VRVRAAEVFLAHFFVGHGSDYVRARDEHVARVLDHEHEVGDGRRINRAARTRPHNGADLRDDAAGQRVAQEDVRVAAERFDAFLNARAARIVETDDRCADAEGVIHDLGDLLSVRGAQGATKNGEVLREGEYTTTVDRALARDYAIAWEALLLHAEVGRASRDEAADLHEAAGVHEQLEALARGQLAEVVLLVDARLPATQGGSRVEL